MLNQLSIRDVVLIDRLDLVFEDGLCALTGETGAGKSIVLDALGLALGNRADTSLIRSGEKQASVTAEFTIHKLHAIRDLLQEHGLDDEATLRLKRVLNADGKGKAFVNDQPIGVGLLKQIGEFLIEIHGQFDTHGLLDAAQHGILLDQFGGLEPQVSAIQLSWKQWQGLLAEFTQAQQDIARAQAEEDYLRHAVKELDQLQPLAGEEDSLLDLRSSLSHRDKILEALQVGDAQLNKADECIRNARKSLERIADKAGEVLTPILEELNQTQDSANTIIQSLQNMGEQLIGDTRSLENVEDRLYELRSVARKHSAQVSDLPTIRDQLTARLNAIDYGNDRLAKLSQKIVKAEQDYEKKARALHESRVKISDKLSVDIMKEFKPLKLEKARFFIDVAALEKSAWGARGMDKVSFLIATNEGSAPGPLHKIASGGELARFMLSLKVVLAQKNSDLALIFDEVDSGIGGAVADAVGDRLARLAKHYQVLVITHSPQVAAKAAHHYRVEKASKNKMTTTSVRVLTKDERREEIARMLSGAEVTGEARAAADKLLKNA